MMREHTLREMAAQNSTATHPNCSEEIRKILKIRKSIQKLRSISQNSQRRTFLALQEIASMQIECKQISTEERSKEEEKQKNISDTEPENGKYHNTARRLRAIALHSAHEDHHLKRAIASVFRSFPYAAYTERHPDLVGLTKRMIVMHFFTELLCDVANHIKRLNSDMPLESSIPLESLLIRNSELARLRSELADELSELHEIVAILQLGKDSA